MTAEHGHRATYNRDHCTCDACREANATYLAEYRHAHPEYVRRDRQQSRQRARLRTAARRSQQVQR